MILIVEVQDAGAGTCEDLFATSSYDGRRYSKREQEGAEPILLQGTPILNKEPGATITQTLPW